MVVSLWAPSMGGGGHHYPIDGVWAATYPPAQEAAATIRRCSKNRKESVWHPVPPSGFPSHTPPWRTNAGFGLDKECTDSTRTTTRPTKHTALQAVGNQHCFPASTRLPYQLLTFARVAHGFACQGQPLFICQRFPRFWRRSTPAAWLRVTLSPRSCRNNSGRAASGTPRWWRKVRIRKRKRIGAASQNKSLNETKTVQVKDAKRWANGALPMTTKASSNLIMRMIAVRSHAKPQPV